MSLYIAESMLAVQDRRIEKHAQLFAYLERDLGMNNLLKFALYNDWIEYNLWVRANLNLQNYIHPILFCITNALNDITEEQLEELLIKWADVHKTYRPTNPYDNRCVR